MGGRVLSGRQDGWCLAHGIMGATAPRAGQSSGRVLFRHWGDVVAVEGQGTSRARRPGTSCKGCAIPLVAPPTVGYFWDGLQMVGGCCAHPHHLEGVSGVLLGWKADGGGVLHAPTPS